MSQKGISVGEKVYCSHADPTATYTYFGEPWMFVLRDTIQFANNLQEVEDRLIQADRTVEIHLGWGSAPDNSFRGSDYTANWVKFYNDESWIVPFTEPHPQMDGIFYYDKHCQPSGDPCIGNILAANDGNITPELMWREVAGFHETGDTQVCVMDPQTSEIWVAWSAYGTAEVAYKRSPYHIKLSDYWNIDFE